MFKNSTFVHKHLLKKHGEFFEAESAKAHDEYMKLCWETADSRDFLPDIMVACGPFGLQPSRLKGTFNVPEIHDPQPKLAEREDQHARAQYERSERHRREFQGNNSNSNSNSGDGRQLTTFIDVDDMADETVAVKVDESIVDAVVVCKKKKRKKNKLD